MPNRLKELREEKGLTLKEFSDSLNKYLKENGIEDETGKSKQISYATISRWENGKSDPKAGIWQQIANYFHVSISYLEGLADYRNQEDADKSATDLLNFLKSRENGDVLELDDDEWQDVFFSLVKNRRFNNFQAAIQIIDLILPDSVDEKAKEIILDNHGLAYSFIESVKSLAILFVTVNDPKNSLSDIDKYRITQLLENVKKLNQELELK